MEDATPKIIKAEPESMPRRDFLRIARTGIAAAAVAVLGGNHVVMARQLAQEAQLQKQAAEVEPIPEPAPPVEPRAHHGMEKNEHGFYVVPSFVGRLITPTAIVIHWTAAMYDRRNSVGGFVAGIRSNSSCGGGGCSSQLFTDADSATFQLTPQLNMHTAHAANLNGKAIGLEAEGRNEADLLGNTPQYHEVLRTVGTLQRLFNIPTVGDLQAGTGVWGHFETDPVYGSKTNTAKFDPGPEYMHRLRRDLAA